MAQLQHPAGPGDGRAAGAASRGQRAAAAAARLGAQARASTAAYRLLQARLSTVCVSIAYLTAPCALPLPLDGLTMLATSTDMNPSTAPYHKQSAQRTLPPEAFQGRELRATCDQPLHPSGTEQQTFCARVYRRWPHFHAVQEVLRLNHRPLAQPGTAAGAEDGGGGAEAEAAGYGSGAGAGAVGEM